MVKAIYAGSFDPITNGHLWVIARAARIFDELIVAVGDNADKVYTFDVAERLELLQQALIDFNNIEVQHFTGKFLVDFASQQSAKFIIRGIRNSHDYEFERAMRYINTDISPEIDTIFLIPPRNYAEVSSSLVKGFVGTLGWEDIVAKYVPKVVLQAFKQRYYSK